MENKANHLDEFFRRNHRLSLEFSRYVLEHPEIDEQIPEDAVVVFLPDFDGKLRSFNRRMAEELKDQGQAIIYIRVKQLAPRGPSRLIGVEVATT